MFKKPFFLSILLCGLTACSHSNVGQNIQYLEGEHIDVAMNYLGLPDNKLSVDERDIFIWGYDRIEAYDSPIRTFGGYGSSSGAFGGVGMVFGGGHTPYASNVSRYSCEIKALTNKSQIIQKMEHQSMGGGCSHYADAMEAIERDYGAPAP